MTACTTWRSPAGTGISAARCGFRPTPGPERRLRLDSVDRRAHRIRPCSDLALRGLASGERVLETSFERDLPVQRSVPERPRTTKTCCFEREHLRQNSPSAQRRLNRIGLCRGEEAGVRLCRRPTKEGLMSQPAQQQEVPGTQTDMTPRPDCGEESYEGSGQLTGKVAVITGGDSGIGRAGAIAYAREGADVLISYLSEDEDAEDTKSWIEKAGRKVVLVRGDIADPAHCREIVDTAVKELGRVDILVNNAAFQMTHQSLEEIPDEEWDRTFDTNIGAFFHLAKAAVPHMKPGSAIIGSSSVNSDMPSPTLAPYAATKAAIANFCASLAQLLGEKGIRVNSVAPGPIWTPLIPATMPQKKVKSFGGQVPLGRPGQPAELAPVYVLLASDAGSYISGARIAVTGGNPIL